MNVKMICLEAIEKIINNQAYSEEVIDEYLHKFEMTKEERALFMDIVNGVILNLLTLEFYLTPYVSKKRYKSWVRPLLYISIYQIYYLDFNEEDIIKETHEMAKIKDRFSSSLVRIILEKLVRNPLRSVDELDELNRLSIKYSYPVWLVAYLLKDYSIDIVEEILKLRPNSNQVIRINNKKVNDDEVFSVLEKEGISFKKLPNLKSAFLIKNIDSKHNLFKEGLIIKENKKSQLIVEDIKSSNNITVLDLFSRISNCANYLYDINNGKCSIYACEYDENNLKKLSKNSRKLGTNINYQLASPINIDKIIDVESFDYVIANVPSSGLGLLGKKIDLKYHLNTSSIKGIIKYQEEIIEKSCQLVKKGGYFIYATDSINSDENEKQIAKLIGENKEYEIIWEEKVLPEKDSGGFYICKLRRQS